MTAHVDPIDLEILSNALRSITDETFVALMKSAYSTNIKERRDHSTAIMDPEGRLVVQAAQSLPLHIASMSGLMHAVLERHAGAIFEGDIFVANDPYVAGGTHLPDITLISAVHAPDGSLMGYVASRAHHSDVGGSTPGSMPLAREIFEEGVRIPPIRLYRDGVRNDEVWALLLANVRTPVERAGDLDAQIAAGGGRFKGIRLGMAWDKHDEVGNHRTNPPGDMVLRDDFRVAAGGAVRPHHERRLSREPRP